MSDSRPGPSDGLRVVAAIGREFERVIESEPSRGGRPFLRARALRLALVCLVALLGFCLATAPGKEVAAWVGKLVGIGDVGGAPTQGQHGFEDHSSAKGPVVIDNGRAPDGARYEWVAYRCEVDFRKQGQPGSPLRGLGIDLEWPGAKGEGGGVCEGPRGERERIPAIDAFGAEIVPSQLEGVKAPDVVVSGTVTAPAARRVRVVYRDARGEDRELAGDFARVDEELRGWTPRGAPVATFVAFVDGEQASRDGLKHCLELNALETVAGHHPAERCAELQPEVRAFEPAWRSAARSPVRT